MKKLIWLKYILFTLSLLFGIVLFIFFCIYFLSPELDTRLTIVALLILLLQHVSLKFGKYIDKILSGIE